MIKRDGSTEPFAPHKAHNWAIWAGDLTKDRVDWSGVVLDAVASFDEKATTAELQNRLIDILLTKKDWAHNLMAGRLYASVQRKMIFGKTLMTVKDRVYSLVELGLMEPMPYSEEEWAEIESYIDHERDFRMAHFQISQIVNKYSIQNREKKLKYETPQYTFMRMALALSVDEPIEARLGLIKGFYDMFSSGAINAPTPNYVNLGTRLRGYASCCLYKASDEAESIDVGDFIASKMTAISAGIGGIIDVRSPGDPVRGGAIVHKGKMDYFRSLGMAIKKNMQAGRGGACTTYYSLFDPEAMAICQVQHPRATEDKRIRTLHFAAMSNLFFAKAVRDNAQVFTFNCFTAPELHRLFFSGDQEGFEVEYIRLLNDPTFEKKFIDARELMLMVLKQEHEVSTNYELFIDETNRHTPHLDPIYSSNLCVAPETLLLTDKGHLKISDLVGQTVRVWNGTQWSYTEVIKTGVNQLLTVMTDSDLSLTCTPYHKFYIVSSQNFPDIESRAYELQVGDVLRRIDVAGSEAFVKVTGIVDDKRVDDTYCVNEPLLHKAVFNGILTGQCTEITQPTKEYKSISDLYLAQDHGRGEISVCSLGAINVAIEMTDEKYFKACYLSLKMIDKCIHLSDYPFPHLKYTARQRMNAGVGIIGLATVLARAGVKYSSQEGRDLIHQINERHAFFMISASLQLGRELGNAPWMHKTKWPSGWLPIDTYKRTVDECAAPVYQYDWETLRVEVIANGGIRNSSLIAHMPTESSSKASGPPNSVYPIRGLAMVKTDANNVVDWVAIDSDLLADQYELAYDIPTREMIKAYAIIQKFTDQAISVDRWENRVKSPTLDSEYLIMTYLDRVRYGVKSAYYQNSLTPEDNVDDSLDARGCASGACTL